MNKSIYNNFAGTGSTTLGGLNDVQITNPMNNEVLKYDSGVWKNLPDGAASGVTSFNTRTGAVTSQNGDYSMDQITDASILASVATVNITSPQAGQLIRYNGTKFENFTKSVSETYYQQLVVDFSGTITAQPNTYYKMSFGGTVTINPMEVGEHVIIESAANNTTINFAGNSFIVNSYLGGGTSNPSFFMRNCVIEFFSTFKTTLGGYFDIARIQMSANPAFCTLNGVKLSAVNNLDNIPDVVLTAPVDGQSLVKSGSNWVNGYSYGYRGTIQQNGGSLAGQLDYIYLVSNATIIIPNVGLSDIGRRISVGGQNGGQASIQVASDISVGGASNFTSNSPFGDIELIVTSTNQYSVVSNSGNFNNPVSGKPFYSLELGQLNGVQIAGPSTGQALIYNGTNWTNQPLPSSGVSSFNSRTGDVLPIEGDYTLGLLGDVGITGPGLKQVLYHDGLQFVNQPTKGLFIADQAIFGTTITAARNTQYYAASSTINAPTVGSIDVSDKFRVISQSNTLTTIVSFPVNTVIAYQNLQLPGPQTFTTTTLSSLEATAFNITGPNVTYIVSLTGLWTFSGIAGKNIGSSQVRLDDQSNVSISTPQTNQGLTYDGTNWTNFSIPTFYTAAGLTTGIKVWTGTTTTNGSSVFTANITGVTFTTVTGATATAIQGGTSSPTAPFCSVQSVTTTTVSGIALESAGVLLGGQGLELAGSGILVSVIVFGL